MRLLLRLCLFLGIITVLEKCDRIYSKHHACVIGAGYSGLAVARYLKQYGLNFTVFEASRHIGGTWRFDPHVGRDEDGLPLFTSMYKNLRTNTPRQTMEFGGFPFPEDTPSYPTGPCFYKYLKNFTNHFDLMKHIQVQSYVVSVRWAKDHWDLTYTRTDDRNNYTVPCGFVICANGQYVNPKMPKYLGQDAFEGNIIHSHDYKQPETFANRRVLLVGAGASGLDLATHLVNFTAKLVHSHHLNYNQPDFPENYVKKPDIKAFVTNGVIFQDDSFEEVDDVIFCTGYDYSHAFIDGTAGVTITNKFVLPIYQHIVNIRHPSMTFIGFVKKAITRTMDAQAEYIAALIAGKFKLPPQEEMLRAWLDHVHSLQSKRLNLVDVNVLGDEMDNYFGNLTEEAGTSRVPPVLTDIRDFNLQNRLDDLLNYRDYDYELADDYHYQRRYNPRSDYCPVIV